MVQSRGYSVVPIRGRAVHKYLTSYRGRRGKFWKLLAVHASSWFPYEWDSEQQYLISCIILNKAIMHNETITSALEKTSCLHGHCVSRQPEGHKQHIHAPPQQNSRYRLTLPKKHLDAMVPTRWDGNAAKLSLAFPKICSVFNYSSELICFRLFEHWVLQRQFTGCEFFSMIRC